MKAKGIFDFYYGDESNQFSFYRIPRQLITGEAFRGLSTDAKLLYGLLLDRMGLSAKNGWYDDMGRVYIYYTLEEIQQDLNCGHDKATKLLVELDSNKGIGLIERVRQGQGKPAKIYVKRCTTRQTPSRPVEQKENAMNDETDCEKSEVQTAEKPQLRVRDCRIQDCDKAAGSYTKSIQTDFSYLNPSINPPSAPERWIDRSDCRKRVNERIGYALLCQKFEYEDIESVAELITDVLCSTCTSLRIGRESIPIAQVQSRFLMLDNEHLEYVFDCLRRNTTQVRNIRAYLLTALYNAPVTMSHFYQAEAQHDLS